MAIITRQTTATGVTNKDAPLTNAEVDNNFIELQQTKLNVADLAANVVVYPTSTASDISTYFKLVTSPDDEDFDDPAVDISTGVISSDDQFIAALASEAGILEGSTGVISISTVGNVRRVSGLGQADFYFEVYKRESDGTETLMGTSNSTTEVSENSYEQFFAECLITSTTFTETDRIVFKYYGNDTGGIGDSEFEFQFGGTAPVRSNIPVPVSVVSQKDIVEDTTPQLGGDLDLNSNDITGTGNINITGTLVSDGLTVDGLSQIRGTGSGLDTIGASLIIGSTPNGPKITSIQKSPTDTDVEGLQFFTKSALAYGDSPKLALEIGHNNDISFYEDTGTTAKLRWDAGNERLDIGDIPVAADGLLAVRSNSNSHAISLYEPVGANENWQIGVDVNGNLNFYDSGSTTASVTFNDNGGVGIGTASPSTANGTLVIGGVDGTNGGAQGSIVFQDGNNNGQTRIRSYRGVNYQNGELAFEVAQGSVNSYVEAMRIGSSGSVGINNTSPATALDVTGTVTADGLTVNGDGLTVNGDGVFDGDNSKVTIKAFQPKLILDDDSAVGGGSDKLILQSVVAQSNGDYEFVVNNDQTSATDQPILKLYGRSDIAFYSDDGTSQDFYWDASTSRLGLGTTSPGDKLDISSGTINLSNGYSLAWGGSTGRPYITGDKTSQFMAFGTNGIEAMRIDSSGRLLIGTSNSDPWRSEQDVIQLGDNGSVAHYEGLVTSLNHNFYTDSAGNTKYALTGQEAFIISLNSFSNAIEFKYAPSGTAGDTFSFNTAAVIDTNGRLGIGTTSPQETLQIKSPSNGDGLRIQRDSTTTNDYAQLSFLTSTSDTFTPQSWIRSFRQASPGNSVLTFGASNTERMRLDSSGRLGIGTTSPSTLLDVSGDATLNGLTVGRGAGDVSTNTTVGASALCANTTGDSNTAFGYQALSFNTTGFRNTASGLNALRLNTTGFCNTAMGQGALFANTTGSSNTAMGQAALFANTTGLCNTAMGQGALLCNTEGSCNTAHGVSALRSNTTGVSNVANGLRALFDNTTGVNNTAVGVETLNSNTTGNNNAANGYRALQNNTTGCNNTASGIQALRDNTTGNNNTATGKYALLKNTTGVANTATGVDALFSNTTGCSNTANGLNVLFNNTTGDNNTASGAGALQNNTTASANTASGVNALCGNTTGCNNTATGANVLRNNTTGCFNTANGVNALFCNTTGGLNTATGSCALRGNTTGSNNTASGQNALRCNTTGCNNIGIGSNAGVTGSSPLAITTASNQVVIGNNSHDCFVAACAWVTSSDCRDKTDVAPTMYGLNFVRALQPVEYKWDKRSRYGYNEATGEYGTPDGSKKDAHCSIGFLAQQVIEIEKQIAPDRKPIVVSEDDPNSLLLSETRIIPALVKAIQELSERIEALENA